MSLTHQAIRPDDGVLLMLEMNHRVANSLQIASSTLLLQARRSISSEVRAALTEAATRISAVALLHRRLCSSISIEAVNLHDYLRDLCTAIGASTAGSDGTVFGFTVQGTKALHVGCDTATQIGLIVTELAINSAKYAGPKALCAIELSIEAEQLKLVVADNGPGLPPHYRWQDGKGVGLRLVQSLVKKLSAKIEVAASITGARFVITIPRTATLTF